MAGLQCITIHWSAGTYKHGDLEHLHYHETVDGLGVLRKGKFKPEANIAPLFKGKYAAHCGGGNSNNIGFSLLGMAGYSGPSKLGKWPLTQIQCERAFKRIAELTIEHDIPIDADHVFTHYEFGRRHPGTSSAGKIDIVHLPPWPKVKRDEVGDFIRSKVLWYRDKIVQASA